MVLFFFSIVAVHGVSGPCPFLIAAVDDLICETLEREYSIKVDTRITTGGYLYKAPVELANVKSICVLYS